MCCVTVVADKRGLPAGIYSILIFIYINNGTGLFLKIHRHTPFAKIHAEVEMSFLASSYIRR